jgi:hypothetical protein
MKRKNLLLRWLPLYIIVAVLIAGFAWEDSLSISQTSHDLIAAGLLVLFFFVINSWVSHNETNFLVPGTWLEKNEESDEQDQINSVRLENKND